MGTAERRLEILKYLCKNRFATMRELSEKFGVSIRTIHRDIYEIENSFRTPIYVKCGKYGGGIYVIGDYSFDRTYMSHNEIDLLTKIKYMLKDQLTNKENEMLDYIISTYRMPKKNF